MWELEEIYAGVTSLVFHSNFGQISIAEVPEEQHDKLLLNALRSN